MIGRTPSGPEGSSGIRNGCVLWGAPLSWLLGFMGLSCWLGKDKHKHSIQMKTDTYQVIARRWRPKLF